MAGGSGPKSSITQTPPDLGGQAQVSLNKSTFEAVIYQKGYNVYHDKATKCPCKVQSSDNLSSCRNCGGLGWVFFNRTKTKMILHSMNLDTQYKDWSEQTLGTVNISASDKDKLGYMDRIIVRDAQTMFSEIIYPQKWQGSKYAFTTYDVVSAETVFMFAGAEQKLKVLQLGVDYNINNNIFTMSARYLDVEDITISIRYIHAPMYHVIDMPRDTMVHDVRNPSGIFETKVMPTSAVGRRAHYVLDMQNYTADYIHDNTNY